MTAPPATDAALAADLLDVVARINWLETPRVRKRLPYACARVLSVIQDQGSARISDLAALDFCSQSAMTARVRRLEDAALVSRTTDSADARAVLISITARGLPVLAQVCADRGAVIDAHLERLDNGDRQTLAEALRVMRSLLDDAQRHR